MEDLPAMSCGGFNPYDSLTTNAKWFFALAHRNHERAENARKYIGAYMPPAFYECGEGYAHPVGQSCSGQCVLRG